MTAQVQGVDFEHVVSAYGDFGSTARYISVQSYVVSEDTDASEPLVEYSQESVRFPSDVVFCLAEKHDGNCWIVSLIADETVFAEGRTIGLAKRNLISSARGDLKILRQYDEGSLVDDLVRKRHLLEYLFGQ